MTAAIPFPANPYCRVRARVASIWADGPDDGTHPDWRPAAGEKVALTPSIGSKLLTYDAAGPEPVIVTVERVECVVDEDGWLTKSDGRPVYIAPTDDPLMSATGWTWTANIKGKSIPFSAPSGGVVDLALFVATPAVDAVEYVSVVQVVADYIAANPPDVGQAVAWDKGNLAPTTDLNTVTGPGVYAVPTSTGKSNMPVSTQGVLHVTTYSGSAILQQFTTSESTPRSYVRRFTGATWGAWRITSWFSGVLPGGTDLNTVTTIGVYNVQSTSHPNQPAPTTGALEVLAASGATLQRYTANTSRPIVFTRQFNGSAWGEWRSGSWDRGLMSSTTDVDTVMRLGAYGVQSASQPNLPVARVGVLEVLPVAGTVLQRFTSGDAAPLIYHRRWTGSVWTEWVTTPGPSEINDIATRVTTLEQSAAHSAPVRAELGTWTPTSTSKNPAQIVTEYTRDRLVGFNGSDSSGTLRETRDNGATWTLLHQFASPFGWVKQLDNGELLASTGVDPAAREVWLSSGYGKGGTVTWAKVLTASGPYITFAKAWSVSTYRNIVLLAEYGAKMPTYQGATVTTFARYVYMSMDHGKTWATVFDLQDYLLNDRGQASANDQHLHGVAWDPYWDRIWVTFGDTTSGTVYSDDLGATWQTANWGPLYSSGHQNVGILPMPKCVLFGTDTYPNGVQRINRTAGKHSGTYTIDQAYTVPGDLGSLTHLCHAIHKVDREGDDGPALFGFGAETQAAKSFIVATRDGYDFKLLWMDPEPQPAGRGVRSIAGPNLRGELIVRHNDGRVAHMWSELVGKAPIY